jgi:hypothetical protein
VPPACARASVATERQVSEQAMRMRAFMRGSDRCERQRNRSRPACAGAR